MVKLIDFIRNVPDFPKPGIQFKDISTLCLQPVAFKDSIDRIVKKYKRKKIDKVAAIEARGYVFGSAIAYLLDAGFIMIRKPGKLPYKISCEEYELEYGTNKIEMHIDAVEEGDRVLIFDDLLATGGTAEAAAKLIKKAGGIVVGIAFVIELTGSLNGRDLLTDYDIFSLVEIPVKE